MEDLHAAIEPDLLGLEVLEVSKFTASKVLRKAIQALFP
jgi:hypothetical protein